MSRPLADPTLETVRTHWAGLLGCAAGTLREACPDEELVRPERRGAGHGRAVVSTAVARALDRGAVPE